jgi:hypothetical protein
MSPAASVVAEVAQQTAVIGVAPEGHLVMGIADDRVLYCPLQLQHVLIGQDHAELRLRA